MSDRTKNIIKLIAIVLIVYGGYELLSDIKAIWWTIQRFFYPSQDSFWEIAYYSGMVFGFSLLLPIATVCGGIGLLNQKRWGWTLSIIVSLIVFTLNFAGTINFIITSHRFRDVPMPAIPESTQVVYVSMIPTYVITTISLVWILLLLRKPVRSMFIEPVRGA